MAGGSSTPPGPEANSGIFASSSADADGLGRERGSEQYPIHSNNSGTTEGSHFSCRESFGSGSSSSSGSEDSLKVHHGSDDASSGTPTMESPAADSPGTPKKQSYLIGEGYEREHWEKLVRRVFDEAVPVNDPQGRVGEIRDEDLLKALHLDSKFISKTSYETTVKSIVEPWPKFEECERGSVHHNLWVLLEKKRRPDI